MSQKPNATVKGFKFAARAANIRKSGRLDLALIYSEVPARAAGVFTTNKVVAAPVIVTAPRIHQGTCQAILINSGNANACTGETGLKDALRSGEAVAHALGIAEELVAVSSTGVIGQVLPLEKIERNIPSLVKDLSANSASQVADAIMTTDAFPKVATATGAAAGSAYTILGLAKGAGMIHPNMATMLAFIMTDALLAPEVLAAGLRRGVEQSFNAITVDGDTSTNDMVLLLANGRAGNREIKAGSPEAEEFQQLLDGVLLELAKMIVRDGEGATKLVEIQVVGAKDRDQARQAARSVATSSLVKTAFFGEDANWGRIIAAVGYSGADIQQERVAIRFGEIPVVAGGVSTGPDREREATEVLKQKEFRVIIDLGLGNGSFSYYTSDLTYDYVRINADYRT